METLFQCPKTHLTVQHRVDGHGAREDEYDAVKCPACTRLHFINRKSGKLLGNSDSKPRLRIDTE